MNHRYGKRIRTLRRSTGFEEAELECLKKLIELVKENN